MAHPDDGYLIPDDKWQAGIDSETGETFYLDDPFACYRLELVRLQQIQDAAEIHRTGYLEELERLKRLRQEALRGLSPGPEDSDEPGN